MKKIIIALVLLMFCMYMVAAENLKTGDGGKPEKMTFIHYKDGKVKIDKGLQPGAMACYKLLGVKWLTTPVSYVVNPANPDGLSKGFVVNAIFSGAEEWDKYTSRELFSDAYTIDYSADWDDDAPDFRNEYVFGAYPQSNVIAVTNIWYFSGRNKRIVEYDVLFNTGFNWGDATADPALMDLQNIVTHETGHGAGLADLYNRCVQETMYGYSNYGEIGKRDLNAGDIAGIRALYGT